MKKITSFLLLLFTSAGVTGAYAQNQSWLVDRSGWTVTAKNETALGLEGGASGPVAAMTDGNENSYWHSNWAGFLNPAENCRNISLSIWDKT